MFYGSRDRFGYQARTEPNRTNPIASLQMNRLTQPHKPMGKKHKHNLNQRQGKDEAVGEYAIHEQEERATRQQQEEVHEMYHHHMVDRSP